MSTILLGVSSSVAIYKAVQLTSDLIKKGYDVEVIETKNATEFIQPIMFSSLTKHKTYTDTFQQPDEYKIEHISLAKKADVFVIVPATANVIAKIANGLADDMLTTTFLAFNGPKIICPAMNTQMYNNPITQENLEKCQRFGMRIVEPATGRLACEDVGKGKLASIDLIMEVIEETLHKDKPLSGKNILITAGPTCEDIDPVRYITNHSSGKMGYALAKAARNLGANVTLVSGPVNLSAPYGVNLVSIHSAKEMFEAIQQHFEQMDYVIKSAAVADYRPKTVADQKIKKHDSQMILELEKTDDILKWCGAHKTHQILCGFAMETENALENGTEKFLKKNCDMLVLNNLFEEGAGFKKDTNVVTLIKKSGAQKQPMMSKEELAYVILNNLMEVK